MTPKELELALLQTQKELAEVKNVLGTLIAWMAQSANSPISVNEANKLLEKIPQR